MPTTERRTVSLNADLGEGFGNWTITDDEPLLATITDANVACGFHAGDPDIMARTCALAARLGVSVGAHVGYPDLRGFGRRPIAVPEATLANDIRYQIGALRAFTTANGAPLTHVKLHGALYHRAATEPAQARAVVQAILSSSPQALPILCQTGSELARQAGQAGIPVIAEGFVDRTYTATGTLTPRDEPNAVITEPEQAARQAVRLVTTQTVTTGNGDTVPVTVHSLCVHSDSPGAAAIAQATRTALEDAGITVTSATPVRQ